MSWTDEEKADFVNYAKTMDSTLLAIALGVILEGQGDANTANAFLNDVAQEN